MTIHKDRYVTEKRTQPTEFGFHPRLERARVGEKGYEAWKRERFEVEGGWQKGRERAIDKALRTNQRIGEARRALANEFVNFSSTSKV